MHRITPISRAPGRVDAEEEGDDPRRCANYPLPTCDVRETKVGVPKRGLADEVGITMMNNVDNKGRKVAEEN